jgi:hypothetical protein
MDDYYWDKTSQIQGSIKPDSDPANESDHSIPSNTNLNTTRDSQHHISAHRRRDRREVTAHCTVLSQARLI